MGNPKDIVTDPILKIEHCIKRKVQDHYKNPDTTLTTKVAHSKILGDIANKSNLTAVTEVIKDYAKDSEACKNSQDAIEPHGEVENEGSLSSVNLLISYIFVTILYLN